jgi:hypothetical protein
MLVLVTGGCGTATLDYQRECEYPDEHTVGRMIQRSNASGEKVHGQFGCASGADWPAQAGYVRYCGVEVSRSAVLFLTVRYSKHSPAGLIQVYLDDEPTPRASFEVTGSDWNSFKWTDPISLGSVEEGTHCVTFQTDGQQYGTADLDKFQLVEEPEQ